MTVQANPYIVTSGLVYLLDPSQFTSGSTVTINSKPTGSIWTCYNFTASSSGSVTTLQSNVLSDGSGTSYITVPRNTALETGSITFQIWYNLENIPLDVGANNNWRGLLCTADGGTNGSPLTSVQEESYLINFSTTHTDLYRRYLNNSFAPITAFANGWQMITYTYDQSTGIAACYQNETLIRSGPMTSDGSNGNPTAAGTALSYTNYQSTGFRIYGGTATGANPNGNGMVPGECANILFYNRALTSDEVTQNFNALRGRFGL